MANSKNISNSNNKKLVEKALSGRERINSSLNSQVEIKLALDAEIQAKMEGQSSNQEQSKSDALSIITSEKRE